MSVTPPNRFKKKTLSSAIVDFIEDIAYFVGSIFGTHANSFCDLETADGPYALVTKPGELVSAIEIRGIRMLVGPDEFEDLCASLTRTLVPIMGRPGHVIQCWFQRDPQGTGQMIDAVLEPSRLTAERLQLDVADILSSRARHLPKFCADERMMIGVWTLKAALPKQTLANAGKQRQKAFSNIENIGAFSRTGTQNILATMPDLRNIHDSAVQTIHDALESSGFSVRRLSSHEMVREIRTAISPEVTPAQWRPCLPGDPVPRMPRGPYREDDLSEIGYPPLSWQIFPQDIERSKNRKFVTIGNRMYAPLFIEIPPMEIMPFSRLFNLIDAAKLPWRISFMMEGGNSNSLGFKAMMASLLTWAGTFNRQIDEAVAALKRAEFEGVPSMRIRMALVTWAPAGEEDVLNDRIARLAKAVASWGNAEVREVTGDPMSGFVASCPLLTLDNSANVAVAPIEDVVRFLPVDRLTSFWDAGGVVFRTLDGRIIPFEPGSSRQSTSNYLFFAPPGKGKSVLMASINLASCIKSGIEVIPYITYLDIGPSSRYFVELMRDSLPDEQRHLATAIKFRMSRDYAVNVFDTQLGFRHPLPAEKSFLVDFLTQLATPAERTTPYDSMSTLAGKVIDEAYRIFADTTKSKPKVYVRGIRPEIDALLDNHHYYPGRGEPWWCIVDFLFEKGYTHEAYVAQRYAVPTLEDIAAVAQEPSISDLYRNVTVDTGEPLNAAFSRLLADSVRDFPVLSCETRFDVGDARILSIDLDEVAKDGGPAAQRQSAIMYLVARFVGTKNFRMDPSIIKEAGELYREYYKIRVQDIHSTMKWVVYDEFHRTSFSPSVRNQVIVDLREGRKWNLGVMLASQSVDDFDASIKEFSSAFFILNAGTPQNANKLQDIFGFNDTAKKMLLHHANGPTAAGAPFLAQFLTNKGSSAQFLVSSISPVEAWGFSTTAEDVLIREKLSARIGSSYARNLLAQRFPGGSAKSEVERMRAEMKRGDDEDAGVIDRIVESLVEQFTKRPT